jgi:hypothetical protein
MSHLTKPQAAVVAMWSYGIVLTQTCGRRTVAMFLALLLGQKQGTLEQRLREWCYDLYRQELAAMHPRCLVGCGP